jgi:2-polyprenyl-3-methyl-5-hydroxy-6-metoxy-1,4-benzoquinol methylase
MNIKKLFKRETKPKYEEFDSYWVQKVYTNVINNRIAYFEEFCLNKKVLHFGCVDWPIFNPENNLHIKLSKCAIILHGFDVDKDGIENLKQYVNQDYFSEFSEISDIEYDVCLVPETIEHVDNVKFFLEGLSKINAKIFIITAPNCFSKEHISRNFYGKDCFIEVVHPDHNCWYSPYTLKNQIEKYSSLKVGNVILLEDDKMICCEAKKI